MEKDPKWFWELDLCDNESIETPKKQLKELDKEFEFLQVYIFFSEGVPEMVSLLIRKRSLKCYFFQRKKITKFQVVLVRFKREMRNKFLSDHHHYYICVHFKSGGSGDVHMMEILYLVHKVHNKILWQPLINCNNLVKSDAINENKS